MPPLQTLWRGLFYHNTHIMRTITHLLTLALCVMSSSLQADTLPSYLDSKSFAAHWTIESESPDYRIQFLGDTLEVTSPKGMTIWRNERMEGRTIIEYDACLMDEGREEDRVSDLNCFWMATDPMANDGSVFTRMKQRQGVFKNCYTLQLYYLGYGGNYNKTKCAQPVATHPHRSRWLTNPLLHRRGMPCGLPRSTTFDQRMVRRAYHLEPPASHKLLLSYPTSLRITSHGNHLALDRTSYRRHHCCAFRRSFRKRQGASL